MNDLITILQEQSELYQNLLALAEEKKDAVVHDDLVSLQRISSVENALIGKNNRLEKKRTMVTKDIANVLGREPEGLTLSALAEIMHGKPEGEQLSAIGEKIRDCIEQLRTQQELNRQLLHNALDFVEYTLNVVRDVPAEGPSIYSRRGVEVDPASVRPMFDARQ